MRRLLRPVIAVAMSSLVVAACATHKAPNQLGGPRNNTDAAVVTAESRYGHGTVSGPVRDGARGRLEVRLPGGTWIECTLSCSETLRRESVDFWENHSRDGRDGPDYFAVRR